MDATTSKIDRKIAVCFYGITRSLKYTLPSIKANILEPTGGFTERRIFAHFYDQARVESSRSHESTTLDREEYKLLNADAVELEEPGKCLHSYRFEQLKSYGDTRHDNFQSLRNLIHALHSLKRVSEMAAKWEPDVVVFARPDLHYHDSLAHWMAEAAECTAPTIFIPDWQHWRGGYNDRFSICAGPAAAKAFGNRIDRIHDYGEYFGEPIHSESFNRFVLDRAGVDLRFIPPKASRVRADGRVKKEQFGFSLSDAVKIVLRKCVRRIRGVPTA